MIDEYQIETTGNDSNPPVASKKFTFANFTLVFVSLLIFALAVCEILGWPFLKAPVERFASKQLERTVRIDEPFSLKLLGGVK